MNAKTAARLSELEHVPFADVLRAAVDLLTDPAAWGQFQKNKPNGWVVRIGNESFPHRPLIARAVWHHIRAKRAPADFEGGGTEFKSVFERFGLAVEDVG